MVTRWAQCKLYFLVLCLMYLFLMAVLQSKLQVDLSKHLVNVHTPLARGSQVKQADSLQVKYSLSRQLHTLHNLSVVTSQNKQTRKDHLQSTCLLPANTKLFSFKPIVHNILYVYSAYKDERYTKPAIRIIALITKLKKKSLAIQCTYKTENETSIIEEATIYEMCENHNKKYGGYIIWCSVPKQTICLVTVSVKKMAEISNVEEQSPVTLNISVMEHKKQPYKFGICVPPLFGNIPIANLVEFVELSKLLGAEHFIFYDFTAENSTIKPALDYYEKKGVATVLPWSLPSYIAEKDIWYNGQLLAHNDCIYRGTSLINIMSINDIDEFIIPHSGKSWSDVFLPMFKQNVIGLSFNSAFYDPTKIKTNDGNLQTLVSIKRTKLFSKVRTKVMVKPAKVFEVGIHHVSKPYLENLNIEKVDTEIGYLHHYRKCVSNYGMRCVNFVEDTSIWRYMDDLRRNFERTLKSIQKQ